MAELRRRSKTLAKKGLTPAKAFRRAVEEEIKRSEAALEDARQQAYPKPVRDPRSRISP